jgi:hypothetical protein
MAAVPLLRPREVVRAFERLGWNVSRQRGSHIVLTKPGVLIDQIRRWIKRREPDHPDDPYALVGAPKKPRPPLRTLAASAKPE